MKGFLSRFITLLAAVLSTGQLLLPASATHAARITTYTYSSTTSPGDAFQAALNAYNAHYHAAYHIILSDQAASLAFASAVDAANAENFLVLLAEETTSQGWNILIPGESPAADYNHLLDALPGALIDDATKAFLRQPEQPAVGDASLLLSNYAGHRLPWPYGIGGYVTQKDGSGHTNQIDFDIQGIAASGQVVASKPGTVVFVKESSSTTCSTPPPDPCWKKANMVVIQHDTGEYSWYLHLAYNSVPVLLGQNVDFGTVIGIEGRTGYSTGIHLHYMASSSIPSSWTDPTDPNSAPWPSTSSITAVDFAEYSWADLVYTPTYENIYTSQNAGSFPAACPAAGGVLLYRNANYQCAGQPRNSGYVLHTGPSFQNLPGSFDNSASSVRVPAGKSVLLYADADRGGGKKCYNAPGDDNFTGDVFDNNASLENQVSSYVVFSVPDCPAGQEDPSQAVADNQAPQISITAPTGYLAGNSVTIAARAADTASGISHVQFFAGYDDDSGWAWRDLGYDFSASGDAWSITWVPGSIPDQSQVAFFVYTWDGAGNGNGKRSADFLLDRTPPTAAIIDPVPFQDSTRFLVQWSVSDNLAGLNAWDIQYQVDGSLTWTDWLMNQNGAARAAWFTGMMGHQYVFRIQARDLAGNQGDYSASTSTRINICDPNDFEPDGDKEHARIFQAEVAPEIHKFCGAGDIDWYSFTPDPATAYIINTIPLGPTTDTALTLYKADGSTILAENGSAGGPAAASLLARPTGDPIFYIRVRHPDALVAGDAVTYSLILAPVHAQVSLPLVQR